MNTLCRGLLFFPMTEWIVISTLIHVTTQSLVTYVIDPYFWYFFMKSTPSYSQAPDQYLIQKYLFLTLFFHFTHLKSSNREHFFFFSANIGPNIVEPFFKLFMPLKCHCLAFLIMDGCWHARIMWSINEKFIKWADAKSTPS